MYRKNGNKSTKEPKKTKDTKDTKKTKGTKGTKETKGKSDEAEPGSVPGSDRNWFCTAEENLIAIGWLQYMEMEVGAFEFH